MATPNQNSPEVLREAILADARRESEQIVRAAQQEAEALLATAAAEADQARREKLAQARAEAGRRAELILATVLVEAGRLRSARVETMLQTVYQEVRRRLLARDGFDYRETIIVLAAEAISRMAGDAFVVKLAAADRVALSDGLAGEIARRVGRSPLSITLSDEPTIAARRSRNPRSAEFQFRENEADQRAERELCAPDESSRRAMMETDGRMESGVIVQDAEGRQMWDNRLPARLERFWPELRRQIAVQAGLVAASGSTGGGA